MKAVIADSISLSYADRQVLFNLSMEVLPEEFFIIIGPNGAGKSTLLKALTAMEKTDAGTISLFEKPLSTCSRRQIARIAALVPQTIHINFPFKVADIVLMGRSPHLGLVGMEQQEDYHIAAMAMELTETIHLAHRRLNQLSGGERQRVLLARAICQQPRILFLDEPTASLDLMHQIRIMDLLSSLRQKQKLTVCMISHDINLAAMYADRMLLMKNGRVEALGNPEAVLDQKLLEESYECRLFVDINPATGTRRVMPLPGRFAPAAHETK